MTKKSNTTPYEKALFHCAKLVHNGRSNEVFDTLVNLAKQNPKDYRIFDCLAVANSALGRHDEAIEAGKKAVTLNPKSGESKFRYARALQAGGHYQQALVELDRALYHLPKNIDIIRRKLSVYSDLGQFDKSLTLLRELESLIKTLDLPPKQTIGLALDKARLSPKTVPAQEAIDDLVPLATDEALPEAFRTITNFHLGRLYESLNEYDNAFKHYKYGNDIKKNTWDPDIFDAYIDKLIRCWTSIDRIPVANIPINKSIDSARLIFVVGMMRSGTSLTEQMLAQLPNVTPGGEMNAIARGPVKFESVPNPWDGRPLPVTRLIYNQQVINQMAASASAMYNQVAQQGIITDKQPYNIFYVPLISRLFPEAKIIHCCRDPQDTCLSNYIQSFARDHPQTYDLYWIGRYHKTYQRMMDAWASLPQINMHDVQYEQLVADPETQSKEVCRFLQQPWSQSILDFHNSSRTVRTASRDQVRTPIYTSSIHKHKNYTAHLQPLRKGLGIEE